MGNSSRPVSNQGNCLDEKLSKLCGKPQQSTTKQINFQDLQNAELNNKLSCDQSESQAQFEQLHGVRKEQLSISMQGLKKILTEGNTIVSGSSGQKFLVHFKKFDNQQDYIDYTDTLIYRLKMLRSCRKARKYLNKVIAIYGEKTYACSGCNPCPLYRVYVLQEYYVSNLENIFQDLKLSYSDICDIFHSFVKVMSAYQYKRLRFGKIDFSKIFVVNCKENNQQNLKNSTFFAQSSMLLSEQKFRQKDAGKPKQNYYCKISDPFISEFSKKVKIQSQKPKSLMVDIYKQQVLKVGQALLEILNQKALKNIDLDQSIIIRQQEQLIKNFLQKLVNNSMICPINNRYNWLQIQRHFQQLQNNDKSNLPVTMIQSFKTKHDYKPTIASQADFKSYSVQKNKSKPFTYNIPQSLKTGVGKNSSQFNLSQNKQNIGQNTSAYITLKPCKKSDSKPNILINPAPPKNLAQSQTPMQKFEATQPQISQIPQSLIPPQPLHTFPSSPIILLQSPTIGPMSLEPLPSFTQPALETQSNSGYGVVENLHPEKCANQKINYESLYNIGKFWIKFQGNFENGRKEGPGTIYLTNGHIFTGFFQKDLANGKGSVYVNGELVLKGIWKNNILQTEF